MGNSVCYGDKNITNFSTKIDCIYMHFELNEESMIQISGYTTQAKMKQSQKYGMSVDEQSLPEQFSAKFCSLQNLINIMYQKKESLIILNDVLYFKCSEDGRLMKLPLHLKEKGQELTQNTDKTICDERKNASYVPAKNNDINNPQQKDKTQKQDNQNVLILQYPSLKINASKLSNTKSVLKQQQNVHNIQQSKFNYSNIKNQSNLKETTQKQKLQVQKSPSIYKSYYLNTEEKIEEKKFKSNINRSILEQQEGQKLENQQIQQNNQKTSKVLPKTSKLQKKRQENQKQHEITQRQPQLHKSSLKMTQTLLHPLSGQGNQLFLKGQKQFRKGEYDQALKTFRLCSQQRKTFPGKGSVQYAQVLHMIGWILYYKQDFDKAQKFYQQSLKIKQEADDKNNQSYAKTLNNLAILYRKKQELDKAQINFEEVLKIQQTTLGKDHQSYGLTLLNIGLLYCDKQSYERALVYYAETKYIYQKVIGKDNLSYAFLMNSFGVIYANLKDNKKAFTYYTQAVDIMKKIKNESHANFAIYNGNLQSTKKLLLKNQK